MIHEHCSVALNKRELGRHLRTRSTSFSSLPRVTLQALGKYPQAHSQQLQISRKWGLRQAGPLAYEEFERLDHLGTIKGRPLQHAEETSKINMDYV